MSEINPSDYQPGTIIYHHPDYQYHQAPGLSSSAVKCFVNQSPRHYQYYYLQQMQERKETDAMLLGTLVHCLVLEPDTFETRYQQELNPDSIPNLMTKVPELKKYCEQHQLPTTGVKHELIQRIIGHDPQAPIWDVLVSRQKQGKRRVINTGLWDKARLMRDGVFDNPDAYHLFSRGDAEVSIWAEHQTTLVKCRCDWLRQDGICADLKTCTCASPDAFGKDCARLGYHLQEVHYTTVLNKTGIDCDYFAFVAIESEPPYLCQIYHLDDKSRRLASQRYEQALAQLIQCQASNEWPGYAPSVSSLSLPGWQLKQLEAVA